MDLSLLVIFAIPLEDFLLVRVVRGLILSRGRRNAAAEALIIRAFLLANEKSLRNKMWASSSTGNSRRPWKSRWVSVLCMIDWEGSDWVFRRTHRAILSKTNVTKRYFRSASCNCYWTKHQSLTVEWISEFLDNNCNPHYNFPKTDAIIHFHLTPSI